MKTTYVLAWLLAASGVQALVQAGSTAASPAAHDAPVAVVVQATRPTTKLGTPAAPPAAPPAKLPAHATAQAPLVQRVGDALQVDAQRASRRAVVEQLAAATGTQLIGSTSALDDTPTVSRHWQGRNAMPLLAQLLDGHIDFAALCNAQGCKVWLQAPSSDGQATPAPPPASQYSQYSPPGPPQADPPGLFPSE
ncbi:hypothetical protein [Aquabacterium sp. CECT 9606]|uniref:hypothetical protein n=1 Tax=Aquabacterium sp. CECT 9606 TaxID=2845822 RepID=UPI001E441E13|nr:hypothetical protein [Aquabacterium sp. CECT 9606]CAH0354213.1 hypothetical protein AQB9606_03601 [Aquabacterium sp. CECT 9606]